MGEFRIRRVDNSDGAVYDELRRLDGMMDTIFGFPSERMVAAEDAGTGEAKSGDDISHQFVAEFINEAKAEVVGMATLHVNPSLRRAHSASVSVFITPQYRGQGIGRKLLDHILDVADNWLRLTRLETLAFVDDTRTIHMCESRGFVQEGRRSKSTLRNGEFADEFLYARIRPNYIN